MCDKLRRSASALSYRRNLVRRPGAKACWLASCFFTSAMALF